MLKNQIELGNNLVSSLADEYARWTECIEKYKTSLGNLAGDCTFLAGCIIFMGPILSSFRDWLMARWKTYVSDIRFLKLFSLFFFGYLTFFLKKRLLLKAPPIVLCLSQPVIFKKLCLYFLSL